MYCYHVIITFFYKVRKIQEFFLKLVIVQVFYWLSRHVVYYLYMNECNYVR